MTRQMACGIFLLLLGFLGCKPSVPSQYLDEGEIEDVLYDYHLADAIAYYDGQTGSMGERQMAYRLAALKKHGVTQEQLDSSLTYYFRHTESLKVIYEKVSQRLSDEAISLGASANDIRLYGEEGMRGDTSNIWVGPHTAILLPNSPNNIIKFHLKADTAFHADSVAKMQMNISSNNHYSLQLVDREHLGIKEVRGFVFIPTPLSDKKKTTLKILAISNLKAVKMHEIEKPKTDVENDSAKAIPVIMDRRKDSVNNPPPTQAGKVSPTRETIVHDKPKR